MHKPSPIPGLTALRLLAAIAVIVGHVEWMKAAFHLPGLWSNFNDIFTGPPISYILQEKIHWLSPFMSRLGLYAVVFFFVLSGFLITHVLIQETQTKGRFSISSFYWRRIIRIWPLYLMIVFLAFGLDAINWPIFHYPNQAEWQTQSHLVEMCYFLFSPNLALLLVPAAGMVGHLWSIGVEEHFYLFWPWLLRKIKSNKKFHCDKCKFECCYESDWKRHLRCIKHLKKVSEQTQTESNKCKVYDCLCGKKYKDNSGLWKHQQKCKNKNEVKNEVKNDDNEVENDNFLMLLLKETIKAASLLQEQNKMMMDMIIYLTKDKDHNINQTDLEL